jgi:hypothetical protein
VFINTSVQPRLLWQHLADACAVAHVPVAAVQLAESGLAATVGCKRAAAVALLTTAAGQEDAGQGSEMALNKADAARHAQLVRVTASLPQPSYAGVSDSGFYTPLHVVRVQGECKEGRRIRRGQLTLSKREVDMRAKAVAAARRAAEAQAKAKAERLKEAAVARERYLEEKRKRRAAEAQAEGQGNAEDQGDAEHSGPQPKLSKMQ